MEYLEKITPRKLREFVGNKIQSNNLVQVLKAQEKEDYLQRIVVIVGPPGCGKTTLCNLLFEELDFNVLNPLTEQYSIKELHNVVSSFIESRSITSFFDKRTRKAVFIDNIDALSSIDKNIVKFLEDMYILLNKHKVVLVITCKSNEEKKFIEMKNKVEIVKINYPSVKDTFAFLSTKNDEINFKVNDDTILELVNKYKGSIRDVILNLFSNDHDYENMSSFKDLSQFETINKLFKKTHNIHEIKSLLRDDMSMVSFLFYENFPDEVSNQFDFRGKKTGLIDAYIQMNKIYVTTSVLEDFMYTNMDWTLYDVIHMLRLHGGNILLSTLKRKASIKASDKYRFSQAISKLSHKNIMNKKVRSISNNNNCIDPESILLLTDQIALDKNIVLSKRGKQYSYDGDESNFISTYQKYFVE